MTFVQDPPELSNHFTADPFMSHLVRLLLPEEFAEEVASDLTRLGHRSITEVHDCGQATLEHEPVLRQFDGWGKRIDDIQVNRGWDRLKAIAAEERLVTAAYARRYGQHSRLVQMMKLLLYTPSSAMYTCPLAMTDGAARLLESQQVMPDVLERLTSADPDMFWTAGQWMTEKEGGSDVGNSSTIARQVQDRKYLLYGEKWFTSAINADVAMTLARVETNGETKAGSRGLSLFFLRIRNDSGELNGIKVLKLKDKLGTRSLPTAELSLEGAEAVLIGEAGHGVKLISTILNITRIYNSVASLSYMQRGLHLATAYAEKREAFGKKLIDLPLHRETLADLTADYLCSFVLVTYCVELLGLSEVEKATRDQEAILRLVTPLTKLYTGKEVVSFMSEVVECFGGMGYIEETDLPRLLRDAQVFPIWEGTTNVLSLDSLRAMNKEQALSPLLAEIRSFVSSYEGPLPTEELTDLCNKVETFISSNSPDEVESGARRFAFALSNVVISYRLIHLHENSGTELGKMVKAIHTRFTRAKVSTMELDRIPKSELDAILGL